jgi:hypothetical protein
MLSVAANESKVLQVLKKAEGFRSIGYVAEQSELPWSSVKLILFQLTAKGQTEAQKIGRQGWVFRIKIDITAPAAESRLG